MQSDEWVELVTLEDIPKQHRGIALAIGIAPFVQLMQLRGGTYIYVPKADAVLRRIRDEKIRAAYNGYNLDELALRFGLSVIRVRTIVEAAPEGRQIPGQESFLGQSP